MKGVWLAVVEVVTPSKPKISVFPLLVIADEEIEMDFPPVVDILRVLDEPR